MKRAPLVAQTIKNLPAVQETQVQSLGGKDPLEKGMAAHSNMKSLSTSKKKEGGILLSPQKEWNDAIWDNMEGPRDHHAQWSKSDRIRHISCDNTYVES